MHSLKFYQVQIIKLVNSFLLGTKLQLNQKYPLGTQWMHYQNENGGSFAPFFACEAATGLHYPGNSFDWDAVQYRVNKPNSKSTYTCSAIGAFKSHSQWIPASGNPGRHSGALSSIWATAKVASHVLAPCGHPMSLSPLLWVCWNTFPPAPALPWESSRCLRLLLDFPP